ncbi:glutamate receptor ionotropic, kainate 2-like isoform X1 [Dermacentor albipictus]|uniref:glutamate receptor ionotropic, kainate 2-like isoform X1 n=2 Tax=Dermacentor albipictus TaxID=60249 RepID=UPI0038FBEA62
MACLRGRGAVLAIAVFVLSWVAALVHGLPDVVRIGGIFESDNHQAQLSFRHALDKINKDITILPRTELMPVIHEVKPKDSFSASKAICTSFKQRVSSIVGPTSPVVTSFAMSACTNLNVPHLQTTWHPTSNRNPYTLNLFPDPDLFGKAFLDLILNKKWKTFTILYEDQQSLILLKDVLNSSFAQDHMVSLVQLNPKLSFKKIMKDIGVTKQYNIILDIKTSSLPALIREAQDVNMMTYYHNYIITSLDLHTLDLSEFSGIQANITAFRLVDPQRPEVINVVRDLKIGRALWRYGASNHSEIISVDTDTALMYDAVTLLATGLHNADRVMHNLDLQSLNCEQPKPWKHGSSLLESMKMTTIKGLTGDVRIEPRGIREDFYMDVIELKSKGMIKVATWHPAKGLAYFGNYTLLAEKEFTDKLEGLTLRVTTVESRPYTMLHPEGSNMTGNDRFYGYCIDLIKMLAREIGFKYEFYLTADGAYGKPQANNEWNGMIRELLDRKADAAIVDLTITYERESVVDFTIPFMSTGISILFRKAEKSEPSLFSFLHPFSIDVWLYMLTAYLGVSLLIFIMGRFTPYEWVSPHPCVPEEGDLQNQFNLPNSFWFTTGAIMQQGSEITPIATSTRIASSMWWFFSLIMISSYTANLAAFLTAQRMTAPIENANDLAKQTKISYGCLDGGSTYRFFENSDNALIKRMWTTMKATRPSAFTKSNKKGVERVKRGDYAYLMEASSIEYEVERDCNLTAIGGLLDNKGYGIATPPGSPVRSVLSSYIIRLQESGELEMLKRRWWRVEGKYSCPIDAAASATNEMGLSNVGGVFLALIFGCAGAICIVTLEFFWKIKKVPYGEREAVWIELWKELKVVLSCKGSKENPQKTPEDSLSNSIGLSSLHHINYSTTSINPAANALLTKAALRGDNKSVEKF